MKQINRNKKLYISWFVFGLVFLLTIFFTIQTATSGAEFAEVESVKNNLITENKLLEGDVIKLSSLKNLEENAQELGFLKPSNIIYISDGYDVAKAE